MRSRAKTIRSADPEVEGQQQAATAASRRNSRARLRNWRVRSRLLLLIVIPTASAIVLGGFSTAASARSALADQQAQELAILGKYVVGLAQGLEDERDQTVVYIAMPTSAGGRTAGFQNHPAKATLQLSVIHREYKVTNVEVARVRDQLSKISGASSAEEQQASAVALTALAGLRYLRQEAVTTRLPALVVVQKYTQVIDDVLAMDNQIAQASNDPAISQAVQVLGMVTAMQEQASQQRALLAAALLRGKFAVGELTAFQNAIAAQASNVASFNVSASVAQHALWDTSIGRSQLPLVSSEEQSALAEGTTGSLRSVTFSGYEWYGAMSNAVDVQMASVAHQFTASIIARAAVLRRQAITSALVVGAAVLVILVVALIFTMIIGRSMVRPLRRLRAGALDVAGLRLPETVRRMTETEAENVPLDVEPIDVDSLDEIGEVARAFDQVHREALRLAANEAALRGNINAMFVNLSRRSQSLVERQIRLIDELEQGEQDSERLGHLFQMDHLATRMRRNSENLLVLAGHESTRRWNQPVALVDVLRAAISEIEQYERVTLNIQPGLAVRGPAVNDVVHLIAELAENATSYSSADTPVSVSGHLLSSGGVLLDITDLGVGMGSEEMAHANWRLDNPPVVDVAVSRRMGLFVVARLAARHGIRVRLRAASGAGLTALVWLPDEVVVREASTSPGGLGRFPEPLARFAIGAGPAGFGDPVGQGSAVPLGAAAGGPGSGEWPASSLSTAEQEVAAARMPRFAPPEPDEQDGKLGPQRIPGVGPHPGRIGPDSTGPIPAVRADSPGEEAAAGAAAWPDAGVAAVDVGSDSFGTVPTPAFGGEFPAVPSQPFGSEWSAPAAVSGPGEQPAQPAVAAAAAVAEGQHDVSWPGDQATQPAAGQPVESEHAVVGAPVTSVRGSSGSFLSQDSGRGSTNGGVVVPPAASLGEENRLPIFEAVESDWFRRGRPTVDVPGGSAGRQPVRTWTSPADEGWKAAEAAVVPSSGGTTLAGLPRRVPKANLIPGTAAETVTPAPVRSAAATRERFASLQRGMREGRAASGATTGAASGADRGDGTNDVPPDG